MSSVAYGSGVGKERVIRWDLRSQAFGVHASAATFNDLSMANPEMGHLGLGVAISQHSIITAVPASMGHLAENIYNMGVANATLGHTVAAPGQTSLHQLIVVSDEQGHTATPNILSKNLVAVAGEMPHEATPIVLAKSVLAANATMGHEGTALQMTLTVVNATMGHNGLAVEFPTGGAANLTIVAATMPHDGLGVEGFSPTQLADLQLWLSPESGVVVSAGGMVEQWNDKSGLGNHATTLVCASMPRHVSGAMNGHNAVRWTTNAKWLAATQVAPVSAIAASGRAPFGGAIVYHASAVVANRLIAVGQTSGVNTNVRHLSLVTANYRAFENFNGVSTTVQAFGSAALDTPTVFRWSFTSGDFAAWHNGAIVRTTAKVSAAANIAIGASAMMFLGNNGNQASEQFLGHMAEVIVIATSWSSTQGRELDKLLGAKYGITIT